MMLVHQKGMNSMILLVYGLVISVEIHILGRLSHTARLLFSALIIYSCNGCEQHKNCIEKMMLRLMRHREGDAGFQE